MTGEELIAKFRDPEWIWEPTKYGPRAGAKGTLDCADALAAALPEIERRARLKEAEWWVDNFGAPHKMQQDRLAELSKEENRP